MASLFDARGDSIETSASRDLFADVGGKAVGVHYTDPETIMKIVEPVVLRPLGAEWEEVKAKVTELREKRDKAKSDAAKTRHENAARDAYLGFRKRLADYRVLDPACGSGNFLYLALRHLKDFDLAVKTEAEALGLPFDDQRVTPKAVMGIEINPYAAELAQVTIWIGEIQWQLENGFGITRSPILGNLANISCHDALINPDGTEASWPEADAIIGNPPFLGDKAMIRNLTEDYVNRVRNLYSDRVPGGADLVVYWFEKARGQMVTGAVIRAGLVSTNSIRGGANRRVLDRITEGGRIFEAWADEPWSIDGAAVRVSLICFEGQEHRSPVSLEGSPVGHINADLTSSVDLTLARVLEENINTAFIGSQKGGPFDISGELAREWLELPTNPNGLTNSKVLRPWVNGQEITKRRSDKWIIDFGTDMDDGSAAIYEAPFEYVQLHLKEKRLKNREAGASKNWWLHQRSRPEMRNALFGHDRYIITPRVAKHRLFVWMPVQVLADSATVAISRDDDTTFGILHSRFHELWTLGLCTWLGVGNDPRYTPSTTFDTFPFPEGLTPNNPATGYADEPRSQRIAEAAKNLNELRENWLNPPDLVRREPEVVEGYPDRILPVNDKAAKELKKRTLTNLYNERPAWLDNAHRALDEAVAAAYGWPADLSDDDILARLLELNLERAAQQKAVG